MNENIHLFNVLQIFHNYFCAILPNTNFQNEFQFAKCHHFMNWKWHLNLRKNNLLIFPWLKSWFFQSTVKSVLQAAASIISRWLIVRLTFKGGLYLRAASISNLTKIMIILLEKCAKRTQNWPFLLVKCYKCGFYLRVACITS